MSLKQQFKRFVRDTKSSSAENYVKCHDNNNQGILAQIVNHVNDWKFDFSGPAHVSCQNRNIAISAVGGLLQGMFPPSTALWKVFNDLTGQGPWSHSRYRYMLDVVAHYLKYPITGSLQSRQPLR